MRLYRYRTINDWLAPLLLKRECYFASVEELNDPFECKFDFKPATNRAIFIERTARRIASLSERDRKLLALEYLSKGPRGEKAFLWLSLNCPKRFAKHLWRELYETDDLKKLSLYKHEYLLKSLRQDVGVCCFSEVRDSTLMFAHYANSHKGCCVGFEIPDGLAYKVRYTDEFPVFREYPESYWPVIEATIMTKSSAWTYEREWRMILLKKRGLIMLPESCRITEVIFGCKIIDSDKQKVLDLVRSSPDRVEVFQALIGRTAFCFEFEPVNLQQGEVAPNTSPQADG